MRYLNVMKMSNKTSIPIHIKNLYAEAILQQEKSLYNWVIALQQLIQACNHNGAPFSFLTNNMNNLTIQLKELHLAKSVLWPVDKNHRKSNTLQKLQQLLKNAYPSNNSSKYRLVSRYTLLLEKTVKGRRKN